GSFSASPRNLTPSIFPSYGRHPPTCSVIAVPRADRSLVVFRETVGQPASLAGGQVTVADRGHDQSSDHVIRIHYGLLNGCRICPVGYVQFCSNELVSQDHETVAL